MADVLFIKTSSLGDVIHHMPAVTEAHARRPDARIAWVVEEAFAPLVALHPAVAEVIPVAARSWRRAPWQGSTWRAVAGFVRALRARAYDAVIDTQGLVFKSALIARAARGKRHGYDPNSVKEAFSCAFYDVRHRVEWKQHAIARNRALTGLALGYAPEGPPDFGLDRAALAGTGAPYGVLLHATARADKEWLETNWRMLAALLGTSIDLIVPFGNDKERERAMRIVAATPRARVPDRAPIDEVARLIAGAKFVVGVDTGLLHLAAALGVPLVAIFCASEPGLTGPMGAGSIRVLGSKGAPPSVGEVAEAVGRIQPLS
ncbi:MAG: lipopolysaccharide heptosyltransferase I [Alphaproteobacteria bacterium]|nr:lipopolysaccharide heptosyltransferase I [Alphaproteobacteria bacterium]